MNDFNLGGLSILDRMRRLEPTGAAERVAPVTGRDRLGLVEITMDFERTVKAVRITDITGLRSVPALATAVLSAFQNADMERMAASLEATGSVERVLAAAGGGEHPPHLTVPRVGDVSYRAHRENELVRAERPVVPKPPLGTSANGYVHVQRDAAADLLSVEADEEWLLSARPDYLEDALREAFVLDLEGA
jgi:DNA-binding protein YbaB